MSDSTSKSKKDGEMKARWEGERKKRKFAEQRLALLEAELFRIKLQDGTYCYLPIAFCGRCK